jgi:hypothetical protein
LPQDTAVANEIQVEQGQRTDVAGGVPSVWSRGSCFSTGGKSDTEMLVLLLLSHESSQKSSGQAGGEVTLYLSTTLIVDFSMICIGRYS